MNIQTPGVKLSDSEGHVWMHVTQPTSYTTQTHVRSNGYYTTHHQQVQYNFEDDDQDMWRLSRKYNGYFTLTNCESEKKTINKWSQYIHISFRSNRHYPRF